MKNNRMFVKVAGAALALSMLGACGVSDIAAVAIAGGALGPTNASATPSGQVDLTPEQFVDWANKKYPDDRYSESCIKGLVQNNLSMVRSSTPYRDTQQHLIVAVDQQGSCKKFLILPAG